jgi:hypothetical protein
VQVNACFGATTEPFIICFTLALVKELPGTWLVELGHGP